MRLAEVAGAVTGVVQQPREQDDAGIEASRGNAAAGSGRRQMPPNGKRAGCRPDMKATRLGEQTGFAAVNC